MWQPALIPPISICAVCACSNGVPRRDSRKDIWNIYTNFSLTFVDNRSITYCKKGGTKTMEHSSPDFDSIKQTNPYGQEYWSARDLAPLLGYNKWHRFEDAIQRAKIACEQSGNIVADHFTGAGKMVKLGSKAEREVTDYFLSRFSCYLIAQNGDPRKPEIAAAQ